MAKIPDSEHPAPAGIQGVVTLRHLPAIASAFGWRIAFHTLGRAVAARCRGRTVTFLSCL